MVSFAEVSNSGNDKSGNPTCQVSMEIHRKDNNPNPKVHRAPSRIELDVVYLPDDNCIEISFDGEEEGEVYVYYNDIVVAYDCEICTSLSIPDTSGVYYIEIVSESWIAQGRLNL